MNIGSERLPAPLHRFYFLCCSFRSKRRLQEICTSEKIKSMYSDIVYSKCSDRKHKRWWDARLQILRKWFMTWILVLAKSSGRNVTQDSLKFHLLYNIRESYDDLEILVYSMLSLSNISILLPKYLIVTRLKRQGQGGRRLRTEWKSHLLHFCRVWEKQVHQWREQSNAYEVCDLHRKVCFFVVTELQ